MSRVVKGVMVIVLFFIAVMIYQTQKPLPTGVRVRGVEYRVPARSVRFLADRTYIGSDGQRHSEQEIFDEVVAMIKSARQYILLDMFLYNDFQGESPETTRALSQEVTSALIAQKEQHPDMSITVISDPLNTIYGGALSKHFEALRAAGVTVVLTDLTRLRDSNPLYSVMWRTVLQWFRFGSASPFGGGARYAWLPHPFGNTDDKVPLSAWLTMVNFKANHRKLIVADEPQSKGGVKLATLVTSANPHDGSSAHSNVALKISDALWRDAVASEQAVGDFSGVPVPGFSGDVVESEGSVAVQLLTEGAIREKVVEIMNTAQAGDSIDMVMFYLSDRSIVKALTAAANRGVALRLILDPNKDAFGMTKNGVPNRSVAHELLKKSDDTIQVRWCDTHGEQCHSKLILFQIGGRHYLTAGSANLTRRNIGNFNLETNVLITADQEIPAIAAAHNYFEELWTNKDGKHYTADYSLYADDSWFKTMLYRVQEASGLSSF